MPLQPFCSSVFVRDEPVPVASIRGDTPDAPATIVARFLAKSERLRFLRMSRRPLPFWDGVTCAANE